MATRTRLLVDHCDAFLLAQPTFINRKRRALFPIVRERQMLVDSLARLLGQLGIERTAKQIPTLEEYLDSKGLTLAKAKPQEPEVGDGESEDDDDHRSDD